MKTYWCRTCGRDGRNLGDRLGPFLLDRRGVDVEWAPPAEAEVVTAGSVLSKFPTWWTGTVLGTGLIQARMRAPLSRARVLAVRGTLTRDACGLPPSTPLGDPGILIDELLRPDFVVGPDRYTAVIPHYIDHDIARRHPGAVVLDILDDPVDLVEAIAGAGLVIASTLHGLIAADALGVPHVLELAATTGGLHKFRDYTSAFDESIEPGVVRLTDRVAMAERRRELRRLLDELAEEGRTAVTGGIRRSDSLAGTVTAAPASRG